MTDLRTAAQQALEALNSIDVGYRSPSGDPLEVSFDEVKCEAAIAALRAALAQEQEPVAWIHTDPDKPRVKFLEWRENEPGYRGRWIKTPLYTTHPQRQPLTQEESDNIYREFTLYQDRLTPSVLQRVVRAVERAHGIIGSEIKEDSRQTLDDAMQQPRAMAQAYESGYNAGLAHERERCLRLIDEHVRAVDAEDLVRAIKEGKE